MARSAPGLAPTTPTDAHLNMGLANGGACLPQGPGAPASISPPPPTLGKRKAETQDNERLSKRLSLLNIERNGPKLYVPVETPTIAPVEQTADTLAQAPAGDSMQVDDSKHKVYIFNMDDELSSESEDEEGKLVFLPDIGKHLRDNRIPAHILANGEGELAGMQMVLYSDPKSLTVPEERDGVRKAIIEARQRAREKQRLEREGGRTMASGAVPTGNEDDEMDLD
ncbi:hypothetical protein EsDP_00002332 [Epichloe bromicola]|uniref:Uncharacterized protein n=1 Tax=Epichloe bromicola TaxID=79588 RepID=A0ABQ0CKG6_9HYPO